MWQWEWSGLLVGRFWTSSLSLEELRQAFGSQHALVQTFLPLPSLSLGLGPSHSAPPMPGSVGRPGRACACIDKLGKMELLMYGDAVFKPLLS